MTSSPAATRKARAKKSFVSYDATATPGVAEFYRLNHENMTVEYVLGKEKEYFSLNKGRRRSGRRRSFSTRWSTTATPTPISPRSSICCRRPRPSAATGYPRWMVLTGFIHDLGKCLCLYGEPQWGVVGDTFPVGCAWSKDIVFHEYFANNPDRNVPRVPDPVRNL